jgi:pimeloyl-[acyl-carrier protein] methyl ester esterase
MSVPDVGRWVLLPGLDGSGVLFEPFLRVLHAVDAVVVRYPDDPPADVDALARHAAAAIGDAARCVVIAESFSGAVALRLAHSEARVAAVVLVASFVRCPHPCLRFAPPSAMAAIASSLARHAAAAPVIRFACLDGASSDLVDTLRNVVSALAPGVLRARLSALRSLDESDCLCRLGVPLLHLRATADRLVTRRLRHDARATRFDEADIEGPHFLLQARPRACRDAIDAWLGSVHASQ